MSKLKGKVAVVTGASKGIGAGIAKALAGAGASVVVNYASSKEGAAKVVAAIEKAGGKAVAVQGDVSNGKDAKGIIDAAIKAYGRLDVLVNNSGVYEFGAVEDITEKSFHRQFDINVLGTLLVTQAALKHLKEGGSIINIGSVVSSLNMPGSAVYTATKHAVNGVTKVFANEFGPRKIRVNAINPGLVETEGTQTAGFSEGDFAADTVSKTPLGRVGKPDDIADVAVFLASDDARWVSGQTINVGGGLQ
ncbi:MAG TPA: glucose 1-dehydrogenase [Alphaproteobacteria bacterium]|nr:glucose 1-dehydrogenase [Alphaproteobacteria bacterium]